MRSLLILTVLCFSSSLVWAASAKCERKAILEARLFVAQENQIDLRFIVAEDSQIESETEGEVNYLIAMVDDTEVKVALKTADCAVLSVSPSLEN